MIPVVFLAVGTVCVIGAWVTFSLDDLESATACGIMTLICSIAAVVIAL